jgi:hypothetical protein
MPPHSRNVQCYGLDPVFRRPPSAATHFCVTPFGQERRRAFLRLTQGIAARKEL